MIRRMDGRLDRLKAQLETLKRRDAPSVEERIAAILASGAPKDHQRATRIRELLEVARRREQAGQRQGSPGTPASPSEPA